MSRLPAWLLYGANGYTGELVARAAADRRMRPILAGRHRAAIEPLAASLGLEARVFGLDAPAAIRAGLAGVRLVLHCAGPFATTSRPMVEACLDAGCHYLDITGEIVVFEAVLGRDREARERGVTLVPGVGFDVVPSDHLAARVAAALPTAVRLELAFAAGRGGWSRGTLRTAADSLPHAGAERRDGRIVSLPLAALTRQVDFPGLGRREVVSIPWGDVSTAFHTTGIANVRTYAALPPRLIRRLRRMRGLVPLAGLAPVKRLLGWWIGRSVTGPSAAARREGRAFLWAQGSDVAGRTATASVATPEGYTLTTEAALECVSRTLAGRAAPGATTPTRAFGTDLLTAIPGVSPVGVAVTP